MTTKADGTASVIDDVRGQLRDLATLAPRTKQAIGWCFAYFFCVLCSYYIIRPLRDEMGVTVGPDGMEPLFVIVFFVMLAAVPLFGWVTSRFSRKYVAPIIYAFFIAHLVAFWLTLSRGPTTAAVASTFFVWVSVFNLFVVSLFWIVMADIWSTADAKRFYGVIAAGGSAGALCGPMITQTLVKTVGPANLLLVSAVFLGAAMLAVLRLRQLTAGRTGGETGEQDRPAGDGILAGAIRVLKSPYLFKIALWVLVANLISTFFYFEQSRIVGATIADRATRVQLFARMDLAVSVLTVSAQLLLTSALIKRIGVGWAVAALPVSALAGLMALALSPTLAVVVTVIVAERAIAFALTNPAARVLYTVVSPEEKYKAQSFIDTVVFRGGDAASGWIFNTGAKALGIGTGLVATLTVPFALLWIMLSLRLGRDQERRAAGHAAASRASDISAR